MSWREQKSPTIKMEGNRKKRKKWRKCTAQTYILLLTLTMNGSVLIEQLRRAALSHGIDSNQWREAVRALANHATSSPTTAITATTATPTSSESGPPSAGRGRAALTSKKVVFDSTLLASACEALTLQIQGLRIGMRGIDPWLRCMQVVGVSMSQVKRDTLVESKCISAQQMYDVFHTYARTTQSLLDTAYTELQRSCSTEMQTRLLKMSDAQVTLHIRRLMSLIQCQYRGENTLTHFFKTLHQQKSLNSLALMPSLVAVSVGSWPNIIRSHQLVQASVKNIAASPDLTRLHELIVNADKLYSQSLTMVLTCIEAAAYRSLPKHASSPSSPSSLNDLTTASHSFTPTSGDVLLCLKELAQVCRVCSNTNSPNFRVMNISWKFLTRIMTADVIVEKVDLKDLARIVVVDLIQFIDDISTKIVASFSKHPGGGAAGSEAAVSEWTEKFRIFSARSCKVIRFFALQLQTLAPVYHLIVRSSVLPRLLGQCWMRMWTASFRSHTASSKCAQDFRTRLVELLADVCANLLKICIIHHVDGTNVNWIAQVFASISDSAPDTLTVGKRRAALHVCCKLVQHFTRNESDRVPAKVAMKFVQCAASGIVSTLSQSSVKLGDVEVDLAIRTLCCLTGMSAMWTTTTDCTAGTDDHKTPFSVLQVELWQALHFSYTSSCHVSLCVVFETWRFLLSKSAESLQTHWWLSLRRMHQTTCAGATHDAAGTAVTGHGALAAVFRDLLQFVWPVLRESVQDNISRMLTEQTPLALSDLVLFGATISRTTVVQEPLLSLALQSALGLVQKSPLVADAICACVHNRSSFSNTTKQRLQDCTDAYVRIICSSTDGAALSCVLTSKVLHVLLRLPCSTHQWKCVLERLYSVIRKPSTCVTIRLVVALFCHQAVVKWATSDSASPTLGDAWNTFASILLALLPPLAIASTGAVSRMVRNIALVAWVQSLQLTSANMQARYQSIVPQDQFAQLIANCNDIKMSDAKLDAACETNDLIATSVSGPVYRQHWNQAHSAYIAAISPTLLQNMDQIMSMLPAVISNADDNTKSKLQKLRQSWMLLPL
jgi:hypothetical protein